MSNANEVLAIIVSDISPRERVQALTRVVEDPQTPFDVQLSAREMIRRLCSVQIGLHEEITLVREAVRFYQENGAPAVDKGNLLTSIEDRLQFALQAHGIED